MYDLNANPSAIDIIKRSIVCHPSLFIDALKARAREDAAYYAAREGSVNPRTLQSIQASHDACLRAVALASDENAEGFAVDMGAGIIALNVACKLQCLPSFIRTSAALVTWPQG